MKAGREQEYESGLEVLPSSDPQALHFFPGPDPNDAYSVPPDYHRDQGGYQHNDKIPHPVSDKIHVDYPSAEPPTSSPSEKEKPKRKKKRNIALVFALVVAVVIGAVVGGVLGSRNARAGQGNGTDSVAPAAMTGTVTSVAPGLAPTAVSWGYPHLEVYALTKNTSQSIYWKWREPNATSESETIPPGKDMILVGGGVDTTAAPSMAVAATAYQEDNRVQNYTLINMCSPSGQGSYYKNHSDDYVWNRGSDPGEWAVFPNLGCLSAPAMPHYARDVRASASFAIGSGDKDTAAAVQYFEWAAGAGWTGPVRINGPKLQNWATPAVVAWDGDDSRLDVFVVSFTDNHLLHTFRKGRAGLWSEYEDLGGFVTVPPTVVTQGSGRLDILTRGGDGGLWHLAYEAGTWSAWRRISEAGRVRGQPDAVSVSPGSVDVFAWGADEGALLHKTYDAGTRAWTPEKGFTTLLATGLVGPPKAMADGGDVQVFAYNEQNDIVWVTVGPDKTAVGNAKAWATVPYPVS